jgi:hypothetical protein
MLKYEYVCGNTSVRSSFLVGSGSGILSLLQKLCVVWPHMGNVNHGNLQDLYHGILRGCEVWASLDFLSHFLLHALSHIRISGSARTLPQEF